jgi:hypothetical protein
VVQDARKGIKYGAAKFVDVRLAGVAWSASAEFAFACVVALRANEDEGNRYPYGLLRWCFGTRLTSGKGNKGAVGLDPCA